MLQRRCVQRKLFQGPPCWVDLDRGTTDCRKYQVFASGVEMIVCTNAWAEGVASLTPESDRAWLRDSSILLDVTGARGVSSDGV